MTERLIATIQKNSTEEIRVSLGEYNGHQLFNARVFFQAADGSMRPSKTGVAFKVDKLSDFAAAVTDALTEAKREGLL